MVALAGGVDLRTPRGMAFAWCLDGAFAWPDGAPITAGEAVYGDDILLNSGAGRLCLVRLSA